MVDEDYTREDKESEDQSQSVDGQTLESFEESETQYTQNDEPSAESLLRDMGYHFVEGKLFQIESNERFEFVNQEHYNKLGDLVLKYIQQQLVEHYELQEVWLPPNAHRARQTNIFLSPNIHENDRLMLIIQGSGAVRPGQWARALCINDSLKTGTIFEYLERAQKENFSVVVLNPNNNNCIVQDPESGELFEIEIREHECPEQHCVSVWDFIKSFIQPKDIAIVAHSYAGICTKHLLNCRGPDIIPLLRAIAFTDAVQSISEDDDSSTISALQELSVNWVTSDTVPLNQVMDPFRGCERRSAGHDKHEYTSSSAIDPVFEFILEKIAQNQAQILESQSQITEISQENEDNTQD